MPAALPGVGLGLARASCGHRRRRGCRSPGPGPGPGSAGADPVGRATWSAGPVPKKKEPVRRRGRTGSLTEVEPKRVGCFQFDDSLSAPPTIAPTTSGGDHHHLKIWSNSRRR